MTIDELKVEIRADTQALKKDIEKIKKQFKDINPSVKKDAKGLALSLKSAAVAGLAALAAAAVAATAVAVKKVGGYIKDSITTAMEAIESENLFDTVMGRWTKSVRAWSMELQGSLGLNAYEIRKNVGVLFNMTKSMGLAESKALDMSKTMTLLAYDMASFYNIKNEEAFDKIRAGITGEAEPLKRLGILIDENTIKQVAYKNGIASVGAELTQQQKVMARYLAIMEQTSTAQGDLARTIDSPTNQLRMFNTQLEIIKVNIGRAFMPIVTTVLPLLNEMAVAISIVTERIASFIELITGVKQSASASTGNIATEFSEAGEEAEKLGKKVKNLTFGFDELNIINSGGGAGAGIAKITPEDVVEDDSVTSFSESLADIQERVNRIKRLLKGGFELGLSSNIDELIKNIKNSLKSIKISLSNIFSSEDAKRAANQLIDSLALAIGKSVGSLSSIGVTIYSLIYGGFAEFLESNEDLLEFAWIDSLKDLEDIADIVGDFSEAIAEVFSVFGEDDAIEIFATLLEFTVVPLIDRVKLELKVFRDVLSILFKPIIDNKDEIREVFANLLSIVSPLTGLFKQHNTDLKQTEHGYIMISDVYEKYLAPVMDDIANGVSEDVRMGLETINYALESFGEQLKEAGRIATEIGGILEESVAFWTEIYEKFKPVIARVLGEAWEEIKEKLAEWDEGFEEKLEEIGLTIKRGFANAFTGAGNVVIGVLNAMSSAITGTINNAISSINSLINKANSISSAIGLDFIGIDTLDYLRSFAISPLSVPKFAMGGFPNTGSLFMAREAGPELVGNIGGKTGVMNNDQIVEAVSRGVFDAVSSAMAGNSANFNVYLDGKELVASIEKAKKEQGSSLYGGGVIYV